MNDEAKLAAQLVREQGWARINVAGQLQNDIQNLFFDLCEYLVILVTDSSTRIENTDIGEFTAAIANRDLAVSESLFQAMCLELNTTDRPLLGRIYDIGTRPMKLMSGNRLYYSPFVCDLSTHFFAGGKCAPVLVKPHNGETLHVFPPGDENLKYNLPIHQDFPYLLQSPRQLTFWLNLTDNLDRSSGGLRIYPGTHRFGVAKSTKNAHGHYEVIATEYSDADLAPPVDSESSLFELYAMDSLSWHSSIPNTSDDSVRLTYIFRVSDIGDPGRIPYGADTSDSSVFEQFYGDLYSSEP